MQDGYCYLGSCKPPLFTVDKPQRNDRGAIKHIFVWEVCRRIFCVLGFLQESLPVGQWALGAKALGPEALGPEALGPRPLGPAIVAKIVQKATQMQKY